MTSRLKHKLELENVNLKSAYINESFVQIGTPLPALAGKRDKLEYVPEWQQEVRDEKGRQRFHGAWTGGFSAGYFNTVGSKEGWTPSTFKSSRTNRATKVQRAEDFMDEEDLEQMNDDRRLENTETFKTDRLGGTQEELAGRGLPSALESLIAPNRSSIGQTLLQKLGWRQGQGIGPRVTLRKLKWQEGKLGKARLGIPTDDADDEMVGDEEGKKHTFAPRDTKLLVYQGKEDREGLGYVKGKGMGRIPPRAAAGPSRAPDDDDDDPYGDAGPSSSALAFAFDNGLDDDDVIVMGSSSKPSGPDRNQKSGGATGSSDVQDATRWHDGRPVLAGFELDPLGVPTDKWFEMPEIPPDWRPRPARVWGTIRTFDDTPQVKQEPKEVIRGAPNKPLTFEQRGEALGEEQRLSKAKSVFEYMSEKDRERIASVVAAAKQGAPPTLKVEEVQPDVDMTPRPPADEVVIPPLSPRTASAALRGYMPYADDLQRQERYRSYLSSRTYNTKEPNPVLKPGGDFDSINKELEDFAQSARIFKPMSFAMSSRFTTGSASLASSDLKQAKPGLHLFDAEKAKMAFTKPKEVEVEVKKAMTPREQAADSGMYGRLTREVSEFYPIKLLCKRFGVADPHPEGAPKDSDEQTQASGSGLEAAPLPKNDAAWESGFKHVDLAPTNGSGKSTNEGQGGVGGGGGGGGGEKVPQTLAEVGMADDVNQGRDTLTYTKPSIDIFKAIFASDDEDDDSDEEDANAGKAGPSKGNNREARPAIPGEANGREVATSSGRHVDPFPPREEKPADLATFKPVFTRRGDPMEGDSGENDKEKRKKKDKDKKKRKGMLSFDVGDEGEDEQSMREEKRKKKEKREKSEKDSAVKLEPATEAIIPMEDDWVEKSVPIAMPVKAGQRKGAADFM